ncbi:MAG: tRNA (adenosine(37)-N6)-threonylcarbamoyltransferase complex ATPase subunit type 1 TsaE [Gemmatimonadota bacterium]|jgi:tRNA threonylcarbamoyladenosine biosynthesis protein TsaE
MRVDEEGLVRWGERIGDTVAAPVFIGLRGPLGAGKSVLARAIGRGAGVRQAMPSPSFNLMFRYEGRMELEVVHLDLYRIESPDEVWELGWDDLGQPNEIVLVEWPERAFDLLPPDRWLIDLTSPPGKPLVRDVSVTRVGAPPELAGFPMSVSGR